MFRFQFFLRLLALLAVLMPTQGVAQSVPDVPVDAPLDIDPSSLSDEELLALLTQLERQRRVGPRQVGIFGIPSGFAPPKGLGFAAAALTNRRDRGRVGDWDASLALGFGLGDADTGIAIAPVIDITSVTPNHFGSSGKISVKLSRTLPMPDGWRGAAAIDLQNLVTWGDSNVLDRTWSLSASAIRLTRPDRRNPLMFSFGYGTGVSDRGTDNGFFAGLGAGLSEHYGVSLGWYGDEAIGAINLWPDFSENLQISLGIGDMTDRVSGRRLLLAVSVARSFRQRR